MSKKQPATKHARKTKCKNASEHGPGIKPGSKREASIKAERQASKKQACN